MTTTIEQRSAVVGPREIIPSSLPNIDINEQERALVLQGRTISFAEGFSWQFTLRLLRDTRREFYNQDIQEMLEAERILWRPIDAVTAFRKKFEVNPKDPKIFKRNPETDIYTFAVGNINFVDRPLVSTKYSLSRIPARIAPARAPQIKIFPDEFDHPAVSLDETPRRAIRASEKFRQRMSEIYLSRQRNLKLNLSLTLFSYLSLNLPDNILDNDPIALIHNNLSSIRWEQQGRLPEGEKLKRLTGVSSVEELREFFINSFTEIVEEFYAETRTNEPMGAREHQAYRYCQTFLGKGIRKEEMVREVCRHFSLQIPEASRGDFLNPAIRLYSGTPEETGKQRKREPSHGGIRI